MASPSMNFIEGKLRVEGKTVLFESAAVPLDVSGYAFTRTPVKGQAVVLGVRPESLALAGATDPRAVARATVSLVEPMGAHQVVWLDAAGVSLAAGLESTATPTEGGQVGLVIDAATVSLFDAKSQQRL